MYVLFVLCVALLCAFGCLLLVHCVLFWFVVCCVLFDLACLLFVGCSSLFVVCCVLCVVCGL